MLLTFFYKNYFCILGTIQAFSFVVIKQQNYITMTNIQIYVEFDAEDYEKFNDILRRHIYQICTEEKILSIWETLPIDLKLNIVKFGLVDENTIFEFHEYINSQENFFNTWY